MGTYRRDIWSRPSTQSTYLSESNQTSKEQIAPKPAIVEQKYNTAVVEQKYSPAVVEQKWPPKDGVEKSKSLESKDNSQIAMTNVDMRKEHETTSETKIEARECAEPRNDTNDNAGKISDPPAKTEPTIVSGNVVRSNPDCYFPIEQTLQVNEQTPSQEEKDVEKTPEEKSEEQKIVFETKSDFLQFCDVLTKSDKKNILFTVESALFSMQNGVWSNSNFHSVSDSLLGGVTTLFFVFKDKKKVLNLHSLPVRSILLQNGVSSLPNGNYKLTPSAVKALSNFIFNINCSSTWFQDCIIEDDLTAEALPDNAIIVVRDS